MTTDTSISLRDDSSLSVPDHVLTRRAAGETVLLNVDNEQCFGLNGVGNRLWQFIETGTTLGKATTALLAEYDVERDVLHADLVAVLVDLTANGLVLIDAP